MQSFNLLILQTRMVIFKLYNKKRCWICGSTYSSFHFAIFNPLGCPGLMPGNIKSKDWSGSKLLLWRIFFLLLLIIVTPILLAIGGPIIMITTFSRSSYWQKSHDCCRIFLAIAAIIVGFALEPVLIIVVIICNYNKKLYYLGFLPVIIILIYMYIKERQ